MIRCNICGGETNKIQVKERMLDLNEWFTYYQCTICGHTHLEVIPDNLEKYYNTTEYYSFNNESTFTDFQNKSLKKQVIKILRGNSAAFKALLSIKGISTSNNILDYGCGAGQFVKELFDSGYINARGFDPFLPKNVIQNGSLYLVNDINLLEIKRWDIITLNHVFEHLQNPVQTMQDLQKLIIEKGKLLLRFPVIDSYAFEKYKENWVQFDAPRHINLFTRKSIQLAVKNAGGFRIVKIYDDSFHFQFTGSNLYLKDLSLHPKNNNLAKRLFSFSAYKYHFKAKKLNRQNKGDQIVVILERI